MQSSLRVGVIGASGPSGFAEIGHIPGLKSHPAAVVAAVCGRRRAVAEAQAARWGIPIVYTDYRELLADPSLSAVTIVTPNDSHAEIAMAALRAGKHVLCEKPLALNVEQARAMTAVATETGRVAMVAFTFRWLHGLRRLKRLLAEGAIGQPYWIRAWSREYRYVGPQAVGSWRLQARHAGSGVIGDLGSHLFDSIRYAVGPVAEVCGLSTTVPRTLPTPEGGPSFAPDVDDVSAVMFRLASGLPGDVFATWATPTHDRRTLEVVGDAGALLVSLTRGEDEKLRLVRPGKAVRDAEELPLQLDAPPEQPSALGRMLRGFVDACLRGFPGPDDPTFADGLAAQADVDAVLRSVVTRRWEPVIA